MGRPEWAILFRTRGRISKGGRHAGGLAAPAHPVGILDRLTGQRILPHRRKLRNDRASACAPARSKISSSNLEKRHGRATIFRNLVKAHYIPHTSSAPRRYRTTGSGRPSVSSLTPAFGRVPMRRPKKKPRRLISPRGSFRRILVVNPLRATRQPVLGDHSFTGTFPFDQSRHIEPEWSIQKSESVRPLL